MLNITRLF